ncbi:MAG TPA: NAD-dependent epimerase/dehydratase family protein [Mycobacteriales bacterium]|nr:NAD-dependent epimerase/dehydratase family protein [Mycobacteriales bacterium]
MTRLLVLGGTAFVGRAVVEDALLRGWTVTTFNRGRTGPDLPGVITVRGDRTSSADVDRLSREGPWDAVVDTSGYVPVNVLDVARRLAPTTDRYVFLSTVSAYAGWPTVPLDECSPALVCPPDAGPDYGEDHEDGPTRYGYQKAGCEAAVREVFGDIRTTVLRPGVILGPHEYVGRLPWWLRRIATGGRVIAPGSPDRSIQPIDVRDVANFAIRCVIENIGGLFNVTAPIGRDSFGALLRSCRQIAQSTAELVWVPDSDLLAAGVRQWSEMPLWRVAAGVWQVDSSAAVRVGLVARSQADTVTDTWTWMRTTVPSKEPDRAGETGLDAAAELRLLETFTRTS